MQPRTVDPTDARVLERNYDYAQRNARLLSMWYECDLERMIELLAENGVELSANDEQLFGTYYHSVKRRSAV
ncbi:hypothetical protein G6M89_17680 [Natronolimnobius sp. AArcel1]|uniref:hypothetical protein n=1 Tax=Natronolimnobius sp. AArcel1 TaxID=1679093 RepID=UPI0013EBA067|nr:hypothetical protein [Natronolimnobius sp. AArcel1]NGM70808.1 hypothetical protein [Natronolimnobius sp. AArcel1]